MSIFETENGEAEMNYLKNVYENTIQKGTADLGTGKGMDIWQWDEGVAMYGFAKAYEKTHDPQILAFMKMWLDYHIDKKDFGFSINTTAPLLGVLTLLEQGMERQEYRSLCKRFADWCMAEAPRADRGCFEHSCTANRYPNQIWADTLFMGCLFLCKWGLYTGEKVYVREAVRQFILHYQYLGDEETGLIFHGYYCDTREQKGVLWGRGNCWFAVASAELLDILDEKVEGYGMLRENFLRHMKGVLASQDTSGAWHTVMNRADTYLEMSATAAFAYAVGRGVDMGILEESCRRNSNLAMQALCADIDGDGNVLHGSLGTCVMDSYQEYDAIKAGYSYFTQGLAMMALAKAQTDGRS